MKKNVGSVLALYPTPAVVVGTMIENNPHGCWPAMSELSVMTVSW